MEKRKMPKAFIFDFDGILADTERLHYLSYQVSLEPEGLSFGYETYRDTYMAYDARGCLERFLADRGENSDPERVRNLVDRKNRAFLKLIGEADVQPLPGAVEAVSLAANHGKVAVCTGAVRSDVAPLIKAFGLEPLLRTVVTADDVEVSKPDPACYALAVSRLGRPAGECLAIEDTPGGLRSARGAGCRTLGVATTHSRADLEDFADRVIDSLPAFRI